MKKMLACLLAVLVLLACAGCGGQNNETAEPQQEETQQPAEEQTVTGTLDEVKDFMLVVTDDQGASYCLNFEQKPEGLADVNAGDRVTVTYTGELSEVDAFTGEILRVEQAE